MDDNSDDNSIEIARKHQKCLEIIKHKKTILGDRSAEESVHRELLLRAAKKYRANWVLYQDADERFENPEKVRKFMLKNIDGEISGIIFQLFDAYMTKGDYQAYQKGKLFGFRKMFGIERRDILMAWKNVPSATYRTRVDMREPDGINRQKAIKRFFVQHYGKAISVQQWEETCDYYIKHFPQYAEKWKKRKGHGIHSDRSDFDTKLMCWEKVKKNSKRLG